MKKLKINYFWFTLIELMVVIAIIWILAIWATKFNFNKLSNSEKLKNFNSSIVSNIEYIRNNALMWRSVNASLFVPGYWRIDFSKSWSWKMLVSYSGWTYPERNIIFTWGYYINSINCFKIDKTPLGTSLTGTLFISWNTITWSWAGSCNTPNNKIIEIITWYREFTWSILINTVSWLIEKK